MATPSRSFPIERWAREVTAEDLWRSPDEAEKYASRYLPEEYQETVRRLGVQLHAELSPMQVQRQAQLERIAPGAVRRTPARRTLAMLVAILGVGLAAGLAGFSRTGRSDIEPLPNLPYSALGLLVGVAGIVGSQFPVSTRNPPQAAIRVLAFFAFLAALPAPILLGVGEALRHGWFVVELAALAAIVLLSVWPRPERPGAGMSREQLRAAEADYRRELAAELLTRAQAYQPRVAELNAGLSAGDRAYLAEGLRRGGAILAERGLVADPAVFTRHEPGMLGLESVVRLVAGDRWDLVLVTEIPRPATGLR